MIDLDFVPETLEWCRQHYVPPVGQYISCSEFGRPDSMDGGCHWCHEMCPYQWEMCQDESWVRGLLSPISRIQAKTREEAIEFIEDYKQRNCILTFKVGDIVWVYDFMWGIIPCEIDRPYHCCCGTKGGCTFEMSFEEKDIGEYVFATKEEAEEYWHGAVEVEDKNMYLD